LREVCADKVRDAVEGGEGPGGVTAAFYNAADEVFPKGEVGARIGSTKVPTMLPMTVWGPGSCGGRRMWEALKQIKAKGEAKEPHITEKGVELDREKTMRRVEEKWGELYRHPRDKEGWCGEEEWNRRLGEVKRIVALGKKTWGGVQPPEWETFQAYVRGLNATPRLLAQRHYPLHLP
jgi:hypothetical protein